MSTKSDTHEIKKINFLGSNIFREVNFPGKSNFPGSQLSLEVTFAGKSNFSDVVTENIEWRWDKWWNRRGRGRTRTDTDGHHEAPVDLTAPLQVKTSVEKSVEKPVEISIKLLNWPPDVWPNYSPKLAKSATKPHLLYPRLQFEHVRLEVGGDLVSLVVERQPAVHKRQELRGKRVGIVSAAPIGNF